MQNCNMLRCPQSHLLLDQSSAYVVVSVLNFDKSYPTPIEMQPAGEMQTRRNPP